MFEVLSVLVLLLGWFMFVVYACWSMSNKREGMQRWVWRIVSVPLATLVMVVMLVLSFVVLEHESKRMTRADYLTCQRVPGGC